MSPDSPGVLPSSPIEMASPVAVRSTDAKPVVLSTIAGHDPSSGAGITADLQTFAAHGFFGASAITALTVQSTLGVEMVEALSPDLLRKTLRCLFEDLPPAGVKIGMLGSLATAKAISDQLAVLHEVGDAKTLIPIVLDPVLKSSSGAELLEVPQLQLFPAELLNQASWITPNWSELAMLAETPVESMEQAILAATILGRRHPRLHIVATGGDQRKAIDLLRLPSGEHHYFSGEHIETRATHGTGCAFSSALLCRLVLGDDPVSAVADAKHFVREAMLRAPGLGKGRGPLNLLWPLQKP